VKPSIRHHEAELDLLDGMDWYDELRYGLGRELLEEAEFAVAKIEATPGIGANYRSTKMKFFRLNRFPYIIYYREFPDHIWIAAFAHEKRRPGYWKRRKPE
jgi:toxin ParE1/3/4